MTWLYIAAPFSAVLGAYWLARCIGRLGRIIFPATSSRFAATVDPYSFSLPAAGRYLVNIVMPPMTLITGTSHFSARFDIATNPRSMPVTYNSYGRSLFQTTRSDTGGRTSVPIGSFECSAPGEFDIRCVNPETIRPDFELEISPHVSPLILVATILSTIAASALVIGGLVFSVLGLFSLR